MGRLHGNHIWHVVFGFVMLLSIWVKVQSLSENRLRSHSMKKYLFVLIAIFTVLGFTSSVQARVSKEKETLIYELLEVSRAMEIKDVFDDKVADTIKNQIKSENPKVPKAYLDIVDEEFTSMKSKLNESGEVEKAAITLYGKHYSTEELQELIAFYKTPVGQKTAELAPKLSKEMMEAVQPKIQQYVKEFVQNVQMRMMTYAVEHQK